MGRCGVRSMIEFHGGEGFPHESERGSGKHESWGLCKGAVILKDPGVSPGSDIVVRTGEALNIPVRDTGDRIQINAANALSSSTTRLNLEKTHKKQKSHKVKSTVRL